MINGKGTGGLRELPLDTVHIDIDAATVSLCWRLTLNQALDIRSAAFAAKRS